MPEDKQFEDESFDISEIEGSVDTGPIFLHDGTKVTDSSKVSVKKYDFTNPIVLSDADLSKLETKSRHSFVFVRSSLNVS